MSTFESKKYPRRRFHNPIDSEYVSILLKRLSELEASSHPKGGAETAQGKDLSAFEALMVAGKLVQVVAGWALDHQAGLAQEALEFVPDQSSDTQHPEYASAVAPVHDHRHEMAGGLIGQESDDPIFERRLLLNLLRANPGGFQGRLSQHVALALEALDFGEIAPMFKPTVTGKKVGLSELRLQLEAIAFVEFKAASGQKKQIALADVADGLAVSPHTLRSWENRLRQVLGDLEVSAEISRAKNLAGSRKQDDVLSEYVKLIYSDESLRELSRRYNKVRGK